MRGCRGARRSGARSGSGRCPGLGDPRLRLAVNLYGAPAISVEEFADYRQDLIVGVSLVVSVPLGQYDDDKLVNVGTNRWSFKPEIGVSKAWGPLILELACGATFFTANDDFLGDRTLEREPMYSLQGHLIYNLPWDLGGGERVGYRGGRTAVDGVEGRRPPGERAGRGHPVVPGDRHSSIKLYGSTGAYVRYGRQLQHRRHRLAVPVGRRASRRPSEPPQSRG